MVFSLIYTSTVEAGIDLVCVRTEMQSLFSPIKSATLTTMLYWSYELTSRARIWHSISVILLIFSTPFSWLVYQLVSSHKQKSLQVFQTEGIQCRSWLHGWWKNWRSQRGRLRQPRDQWWKKAIVILKEEQREKWCQQISEICHLQKLGTTEEPWKRCQPKQKDLGWKHLASFLLLSYSHPIMP